MARDLPGFPGAPQRPNLELLGQLATLLASSQGKKPDPAANGAAEPSKLLREIIHASFADDARGLELREGWKLVGAGALKILRAFSEEAPPADEA